MTRLPQLGIWSLLAALVATPLVGQTETPPIENGAIKNDTLVANKDIANAQAVGVISSFMTKGAQQCDAAGQCRSVFGADDKLDYSSMQSSAKLLTGSDSFSFLDKDGASSNVSAQTSSLVLICGDYAAKVSSGIAIKATNCVVNAEGAAQLSFRVCTAPSRQLPVTQPSNAVPCSDDPASPSFKPPPGKVCLRAACDTEPEGSLNGWSAEQTVTFDPTLAETATPEEKTANGMAMVFYPPLDGSVPKNFKADSDNLTVVKVVQTFVSNTTQRTALGLRVAYRHKSKLSAEMITQGPGAVPNPRDHTAAWDTITKLQGNAMIPQYQQKYAKNGSECIQQVQNGLAGDGTIKVCDEGYTNESGITALAKTAKVAAEGDDCGTTQQCLQQVVNTNTWTQSCRSDVPLSLRKCQTITDYTLETITSARTRSEEICHEKRTVAQYSCTTQAAIGSCQLESVISQGGVALDSASGDTSIVLESVSADGLTGYYRMGTIGDNYWGSGYYSRDFHIDIVNKDEVKTFKLYYVRYDDELAVAMNNTWLYVDFPGGYFNESVNRWGRDGFFLRPPGFQSFWERATGWSYGVSIDMIPYLVEGRNTLRMDVGVAGGGEGWLYLEISAYRPKCEMTVDNQCAPYEAAQ